ncbi:MAG: hypothetical protein DCC88_00115 [Spirobacillus cienkowskii]|uniref:Uncharacterized protein n=1 Tax=Spirobacillus cienkowskii TaxID=495820 RepID=A0A369L063_9BACT|nr:MAG: hypothetical protein DCC88_00115 [Spirobacillus cienkowskii]
MSNNIDIIKCFENHILTVECDHENSKTFVCKNPDSFYYYFRLTFIKNHVFLTGDLGELILINDRDNMLKWLLNTIDNLPYLYSKVPLSIKQSLLEFDKQYAYDFLCEQYSKKPYHELKDNFLESALDELNKQVHNSNDFIELLEEYNIDYCKEDDSFQKFTNCANAKFAALSKFCELYKNIKK